MRTLRFLVNVAFLLFERFRGTKTIHEIKRPCNAVGSLTAITVRGYAITIHCQRKEYHVKYDRWYIPDHVRTTYNVFSVVSSDAPEVLRKACELDVDLPAFIPRWNFDNEIRRIQVLAYLDLLEQRLRKIEMVT